MNTFTQTDVQPQHAGARRHDVWAHVCRGTWTNFVSRLSHVGPSVTSFCRMVHLFGKWANIVSYGAMSYGWSQGTFGLVRHELSINLNWLSACVWRVGLNCSFVVNLVCSCCRSTHWKSDISQSIGLRCAPNWCVPSRWHGESVNAAC